MDAVNGTTSLAASLLGEPPRPASADGLNPGSANEAAFTEMIMPMVIVGCMNILGDLLSSLQREIDEVAEELRGD